MGGGTEVYMQILSVPLPQEFHWMYIMFAIAEVHMRTHFTSVFYAMLLLYVRRVFGWQLSHSLICDQPLLDPLVLFLDFGRTCYKSVQNGQNVCLSNFFLLCASSFLTFSVYCKIKIVQYCARVTFKNKTLPSKRSADNTNGTYQTSADERCKGPWEWGVTDKQVTGKWLN